VPSTQEFIEYLRDQLGAAGDLRFRKMFGEYAVYLENKVVGLVCDDRLFVKPTETGRAYIGVPTEARPYSGARPYFLMEEELDDRQWMADLLRITASELPQPQPKRPRSRQRSGAPSLIEAEPEDAGRGG